MICDADAGKRPVRGNRDVSLTTRCYSELGRADVKFYLLLRVEW
jgi:hypothetical protein